jgi:hypothetical protein
MVALPLRVIADRRVCAGRQRRLSAVRSAAATISSGQETCRWQARDADE